MNFESRENRNARVNVQKLIKLALEKIHSKQPVMKNYLNKETIKTGYSVRYTPTNIEPNWILFPYDRTS